MQTLPKYGFELLGLVDVGSGDSNDDGGGGGGSQNKRRVTVFLPDGTFTMLELDAVSTTLGEMMERALRSRRTSAKSGFTGREGFTFYSNGVHSTLLK